MSKRILLIVSGGIAAYKAPELVRLLRKDGIAVRAVMTQAARQFVTPLSLGTVTEDNVYTDLFDLKDEREIGHIQLSRQADLIVVAPATANILAKMAGGIADDLATTLLLATDKPVLAAPAMNVRMWSHPATQRSIAQLRADGVTIMEPDEGDMACGEYGPGRLPAPEAILASIRAMLAAPLGEAQAATARFGENPPPLAGKRALVTAGPTHEPIDPVRYIANRSSGKQGFAIAGALAALGADVTLVAGPVSLATPPGVRRVNVETAREMAAAVEAALPADVAVMVAAVADWRAEATAQKIKKDKGGIDALPLVENPDILAGLSKSPRRPRLVIGFAAETEKVVEHATAKRARKGCDWIVANDVSGDVMGGADNRIHLVTHGGVEDWPKMEKGAVARRLAQRIADELSH
ncbi:bifunctional phosphopantothenoylcysteine decarboxylase/phosphopantothenate--cysteine ligase CoaBC [Sphingosinicella soli]|uniref:Coenzyme A biosynthesis bifunctional protein CoaBC n=1 Tax=Sphingosinicella soli TaxID=333708 RepID=A0A7W7F8D3_9SPHN|nr:phosphopantothenoylcysteine decarboxylase/phosphopantothenate--cysteine ligase [Sphingosinicella soli]